MSRRLAPLAAFVIVLAFSTSAQAQWATQWHAPVVVAPQPVVVAHRPVVVHQPVHRVYRSPVVVQHPTRVYTRRRPILGGTVVHTRPGHRQIIW